MTADKSANQAGHDPLDKALGLLAGCAMVILGFWLGLRPETVLWRSLVVGGLTMIGSRVVFGVLRLMAREEED